MMSLTVYIGKVSKKNEKFFQNFWVGNTFQKRIALEAYIRFSQTSMMKFFPKIVNG